MLSFSDDNIVLSHIQLQFVLMASWQAVCMSGTNGDFHANAHTISLPSNNYTAISATTQISAIISSVCAKGRSQKNPWNDASDLSEDHCPDLFF